MDDRLQRVREQIDREVSRRHANRVLHGHPSPQFWLDQDIPVETVMEHRRTTRRVFPTRLSLYVATPYCLPTKPDRCGFCLFPSEIYRNQEQLDVYLRYLGREGEMYSRFFQEDRPTSVYFGGGTSNLYKARQYDQLLAIVRRMFPRLPPGTEITLEGVPQLFTKEKLVAMRNAGITRISIGAQQLADEMIKMSGRKQKGSQVLQAIAWCHELGLGSSVDLIFGWPRQTVEGMLKDLDTVVQAGVGHITHYELNVAGRTDFARNRRPELPSTDQNVAMYRASAEFLRNHGYAQVTTFDWEKTEADTLRYEDHWYRRFAHGDGAAIVATETWAWGFAGVSVFPGTPGLPGWSYMNCRRVEEYFARIDQGRFPVERGFHYTEKDLRLMILFQMLQCLRVDLQLYEKLFGVNLVDEYRDIWPALQERGWVEVSERQLTLVGDGVFYTPLIQGLLAAERLEELRKVKFSNRANIGAESDRTQEVA